MPLHQLEGRAISDPHMGIGCSVAQKRDSSLKILLVLGRKSQRTSRNWIAHPCPFSSRLNVSTDITQSPLGHVCQKQNHTAAWVLLLALVLFTGVAWRCPYPPSLYQKAAGKYQEESESGAGAARITVVLFTCLF